MKAIILAAGRGSRMKTLTENKPKCLINVKDKPLIEWQISALREAGISEIAIVTGYKSEMLNSYGLYEFHNPKWAETQMVSSLMCASEWLEQDECVVSYSDIFYESQAIRLLIECGSEVCITYDPNWETLWKQRFEDPLSDAETFRIDSESLLIEIGGRAKSVSEIQGQYMGLLRFKPAGWKKFRNIYLQLGEDEGSSVHMTSLLQYLIKNGEVDIKAQPYFNQWMEYDSIADLSQ